MKSFRTFGSKGQGPGEFDQPTGIAWGTHNTLYVSDSNNHRIQRFSVHTHAAGYNEPVFVCTWGSKGSGNGEFCSQDGIAVGVRDGSNPTVMGKMHSVLELAAFPPGVLPVCAAYIGEEYVVVSDCGNSRIQVFDANGKFIRKWGRWGDKSGEFRHPAGCALDAVDYLYVCDAGNHRIQVFNTDGLFLAEWGSRHSNEVSFEFPLWISVDQKNRIVYVSDNTQYGIQCFQIKKDWKHGSANPHGIVTHTYGMDYPIYGDNPVQAERDAYSSSTFVDSSSVLYVVDQESRCIRVYNQQGGLPKSCNIPQPVLLTGISGGDDGTIYITDRKNHCLLCVYHCAALHQLTPPTMPGRKRIRI